MALRIRRYLSAPSEPIMKLARHWLGPLARSGRAAEGSEPSDLGPRLRPWRYWGSNLRFDTAGGSPDRGACTHGCADAASNAEICAGREGAWCGLGGGRLSPPHLGQCLRAWAVVFEPSGRDAGRLGGAGSREVVDESKPGKNRGGLDMPAPAVPPLGQGAEERVSEAVGKFAGRRAGRGRRARHSVEAAAWRSRAGGGLDGPLRPVPPHRRAEVC